MEMTHRRIGMIVTVLAASLALSSERTWADSETVALAAMVTTRPPAINSLTNESTAVRGRALQPAVIAGPLGSGGGPVQTFPLVYVVYWGWGADLSSEQAYLQNFLSTVGGTPWLGTVTQYFGAGNPTGLLRGTWSDPSAIPVHPTDAQIQAEAAAAMSHFALTNDINYQVVVATPTGHSTTGFGVTGGFCAYHGRLGGAFSNVTYTNLPYMTDAGSSCGAYWVQGPLDGVSIVEGHELAEIITDPWLNAWKDVSGNEIGDKCAWTGLTTISTSSGTYAVQPLWSNVDNGCVTVVPGRLFDTANMSAGIVNPGCPSGGGDKLVFSGYSALANPKILGSYSPRTLTGGALVQSFRSIYGTGACSGPIYNNTLVNITGFGSDPGRAWLKWMACGGVTLLGSDIALAYGYGSGTATWTKNHGPGYQLTGLTCTVVH